MYLRGNYWHYDFFIGKKRYRGTTGFRANEKRKAAMMVDLLKAKLREEFVWTKILHRQPPKEYAEQPLDADMIWSYFIRLSDTGAAEHRQKIYRARLRDFCSYIRDFHPETTLLSEVTNIHAQKYRVHLKKCNISNSTANDHLAALKMIFKLLAETGKIASNPFAGIKRFPADKVKREIFSSGELRTILNKSSGWMHHLFIMAAYTGLREGDICMLKKSEIDGDIRWITIEKTRKTGAKVDIPVLPPLARHLREQLQQSSSSEYVCPELAELYCNSPKKISRDVKKFLHDIGIIGTSQQVEGYCHRVSVKDIHSLRHTFIYLAAKANIPLPVIQSVVGHATEEMTRYYTEHARREDKLRFMDLILANMPNIEPQTDKPSQKSPQ